MFDSPDTRQRRRDRLRAMRRLPIPEWMVMALAFGSVVLLMTTGVRLGVSRKTRTSFAGAEFIEDSKAGGRC